MASPSSAQRMMRSLVMRMPMSAAVANVYQEKYIELLVFEPNAAVFGKPDMLVVRLRRIFAMIVGALFAVTAVECRPCSLSRGDVEESMSAKWREY